MNNNDWKIKKILLWPIDTPTKDFQEIRIRVSAILVAILCLILFFGSIAEQMEKYFC